MTSPSLDDAMTGLKAVYDYNKAHPKEPRLAMDGRELTDVGNAHKLAELLGGNVHYVADKKLWIHWNGKVWQYLRTEDKRGIPPILYKKAIEVANEWDTIAEINPNAGLVPEYHKWAKMCKGDTKIKAMISLLAGEDGIVVTSEIFDTEKTKMLFNMPNGTYDFDRKAFREHRRDDYITKMSPVPYEPAAKRDLWEKFLNDIFAGNKNIIGYMKRTAGYAMTGLTKEEDVNVLYGVGGNGKSKYTGQIAHNMGNYHARMNIETIQSVKNRNGSAPSPDVIDLMGARLVTCSEPEMNTHLNESRVKDWTGRETIKARGLNEKPISFVPLFKLWIATNYELVVKGNDNGIKRRLKQIPYTVVFDKPDLDLDKKLLAESSGILNWMIEGCLEYLTNGLQVPEEIVKATADYIEGQDTYGDFINVCCLKVSKEEQDELGITPLKKLYNAYILWCEVEGKYHLKDKQFGTWLTNAGFEKRDSYDTGGRKYAGRRGIRLVPEIGDAIDLMVFSSEQKDDDGENLYAKNRRAAKDLIRQIANKQLTHPDYSAEARKILQENFGSWEKPGNDDAPRAKQMWASRLRLVLLEHERDITDDEAMRYVEQYWQERDKNAWHVPQVLKLRTLRDIIKRLQDGKKSSVPLSEILSGTARAGIGQENTTDMIMKLKSAGEIIEASEGRFRVV